eukprot:scaffold19351_cov104-Skeletonema_marinoi.AAC.1
MVPYSLSACQVVRVFCAVLRALGTSPIMALGIVFLTGYPTSLAKCYLVRSPPAPSFVLRATSLSKIFLSFGSHKNNGVGYALIAKYQITTPIMSHLAICDVAPT